MYTVRPWLFISNYRDSTDSQLLLQHRIGALLHLAEPVAPAGIESLYLAVEDGELLVPSLLEQGTRFILQQHTAGQRVLVACGAGISRSVSFAVAALKKAEGLRLVDSYHAIRQVHPEALPHPALWRSLQAYFGDATSFLDLLDHIQTWEAT